MGMLNLREAYLSRKGFTLIEVVVSIALASILISSIYSLLAFTEKVAKKSDDLDLLLYNGRYAMEYIKGEINSADKIISSSDFKDLDKRFPSNIGFVAMKEVPTYDSQANINYNFVTYYHRDNELVRLAYTSLKKPVYSGYAFDGFNQVTDSFRSLNNSLIDVDNNLIIISIELERGDAELVLESTIKIRCEVE